MGCCRMICYRWLGLERAGRRTWSEGGTLRACFSDIVDAAWACDRDDYDVKVERVPNARGEAILLDGACACLYKVQVPVVL